MRWRVPQPSGAGRWDGGDTKVPVISPGSAASHGTGPREVSLRVAQNGSGPQVQWMCPASAVSSAGGGENAGAGIFPFWTCCLGKFMRSSLWMCTDGAGTVWGAEKYTRTVHTVPSGTVRLYPCSTATHGGIKHTLMLSISYECTAAWISLKTGPSLFIYLQISSTTLYTALLTETAT